ncbi:MAG: SGNH/GDSL hydrolase family protein [Magnetococcales bacterium]|nr:SGNH/GDSL hydrolase family protein [Magnetococcales bacterium]
MTERQKNVLAALTGILVSLALAELFVSLFYSNDIRVMGDTIRLRTNLVQEIHNRQGIPGLDPVIVHRKNSLGFRGPDPPADLPDRYRILTVGGSTTESYYISDGKTWPDLVAAGLNQKFADRIWLNNAGLDGHSTFGHLILLRDYVLRDIQPELQHTVPNLILFFIGANEVGRRDLRARLMIDPRFQTGEDIDWAILLKSLLFKVADHSDLVSLGINLFRGYRDRHMGLAHQPVDVTRAPRGPEIGPEQQRRYIARHEEYLAPLRERLAHLLTLTRRQGIQPVFMTQPALFGCGKDPLTGVDLGSMAQGGINGCLKWRVLDAYNDAVREFGSRQRVPVIDLARELPHSSEYFYDNYHFNTAGTRRVADIVLTQLAPLVADGLRKNPAAVSGGGTP